MLGINLSNISPLHLDKLIFTLKTSRGRVTVTKSIKKVTLY